MDASSLSRPVRPLHSSPTAATTAAAAAAPSTASPPSSSVSAASEQLTQSQPITFLAFIPTASAASSGSLSVDSGVLRCLMSQLSSLLSLPSDAEFLSHCLHNSSLQLLLSSYLHHASQQSAVPAEYAGVTEAVYHVFHRLTAVSSAAALSAAHFVTLPLLLQFASLYHPSMPDSTAAIVDRLMVALSSLPPQLSAFCAALSQSLASLHSGLSLPAPVSFIASSTAFLSASFGSLYALFACTPSCPSTAPFAAHSSFLSVSVRLYDRLCELGRDSRGEMASAISECRRAMIGALHAIIDKAFIQSLQRESGDVKRLSERVYQLLADCQQHTPLFLAHYAFLYRLSADVKKITALPAVVAALGAPRVSQLLSFLPPAPSAVPLPTASLFRSRSSESKEEQSLAELCAMLDNAISADFARACLREYNGELDVTLQHIFDNALPARLQHVSVQDRRHWKEDGDSMEEGAASERQGDILADVEDDGSSAFQQYLLRTGRVLKSEDKTAAALSRSSLSLFEAEPSVKEMLKERIIASQALDAVYDDELDDSYSSFLSFAVDETAVDVNDRTDSSRRAQQHDRASATTGEAAGRGQGGDEVRARWRREEEERERRRDEETARRIELIAPSRRTEEENKEWKRLSRQQSQQTASSSHSTVAAAPAATRGMRGMRARGGQLSRGGGGRGVSATDGGNERRTAGAPFMDGSLSPPRDLSHASRGRGGRGRDGWPAAGLSTEEKEAERSRRAQQAVKEKEARRRRLHSDEDDNESGDEGMEEDEMDLTAQPVLLPGRDGGADGGQEGDNGAEGGGNRGRGRGNMRHSFGSGPRNSAGGGGRGGRGRGHNARGAHKAAAMRKMNSGMIR